MSDERIIVHGSFEASSIVIDDMGSCILITPINFDNNEGQTLLPLAEYRRLGEWLIERANQAGER